MFVLSFISQLMKRSKHGLFVFLSKKTFIWRRHCSISQSCCSTTSKRSIDWFLESASGMKVFQRSVHVTNQTTRVCIRSTKPIKSLCFRLVCCFYFVRAFSFQGHTKIALTAQNMKRRYKNQSKYRRRNRMNNLEEVHWCILTTC